MHREQTRDLAITALFVAIFLLQTFVPNIGYIRILPGLPAITTVPLTVAVYSTLMGPIAGTFFGLFWGFLRLFLAYTQPGDMISLLLFQNIFISLIPSIFAGLLPGLIGRVGFQTKGTASPARYAIAGAVTSLANTILVIALTSLIFMGNPNRIISYMGNFASGTPLIEVLIITLGMNGIIEALFTAIITPVIVTPLKTVMSRLS